MSDYADADAYDEDGNPLDDAERARRVFPRIDWHALWSDDDDERWIHYPLLPARRLVALYSPPKVGKSLLMLEMAVKLSRGETFLSHTPDRRYRILYVDFENDPRGDIRARLRAMRYGPDDLDHLDYLTFPSLAALDTARGGAELVEVVKAYGSDAVVVETVSRTIAGEENDNDTWLNFYRCTGLPLKRLGVALIRLDHSGKDESKGMRGGSAKSGDVDAVWRLSRVTESRFRLECTDVRFELDLRMLHLARLTDPLRHVADNLPADDEHEQRVADIIALCDEAGLPVEAGRDTVSKYVKSHGIKARNSVLSDVVKRRKAAGKPVPDSRGQVISGTCPQLLGDSSGQDEQISRNAADSGCPQTSGTGRGQVPSATVPVSVPHVVGTGQAGHGTDAPECLGCGQPLAYDDGSHLHPNCTIQETA